MTRGKLIVFEGIDGSGTSTQVRLLHETMVASLRTVHATAQPSGGPIGNMVRQILRGRIVSRDNRPMDWQTMALLFAADRQDQQQNEILPHLENGVHVICDRYVQSSIVYQGVSADDSDAQRWIGDANRYIIPPDVVFYLRIDAATAAQRRAARNEPAEIFDDVSFQEKLIAVYDRMAAMFPGVPVMTIDATQSVEDIATSAWRVVSKMLNGED
ncbi:MAG: dTMP kinase [Myxococcales bacterium]|jgi:dTMP kinase|nr:dTMP kinase [Myxococcales bacterium]